MKTFNGWVLWNRYYLKVLFPSYNAVQTCDKMLLQLVFVDDEDTISEFKGRIRTNLYKSRQRPSGNVLTGYISDFFIDSKTAVVNLQINHYIEARRAILFRSVRSAYDDNVA
jgi:hypothetical protein